MSKKVRAKELYVSGKNITDVAIALGVTRTTIYNYKAEDLKNGIDWEALRYNKNTNASTTDADEKRFLNILIESFEIGLAELNELEAPKRLEALTKFVNAYWKIKQPNKSDCKSAKASGASEAIYVLSQVAMEQENESVIQFLSEYHDIIVERVLSQIKH